MTDLETFENLLKKAKRTTFSIDRPGDDRFDWAKDDNTLGDPNCAIRVHVMAGYRCHFEVEFDKDGNILNMGQWDEL